MRFIRRAARRGDKVNDPLATKLIEIGNACSGRGVSDVPLFLALETVFPPDLRTEPRFTAPLIQVYDGADTSTFKLAENVRTALVG
jgi:fructuronate reductase